MACLGYAPGCIFHWKQYEFADGQKANKFFVIVGAKQGSNFLAVIATSKQHKKDFVPGCNAKDGYYHIPGGGNDWFPLDTWLLIAEPKEIDPAKFKEAALTHKGDLRTDIANAIRNCIKQCKDVSEAQIALL
jgi:hypothetical protein